MESKTAVTKGNHLPGRRHTDLADQLRKEIFEFYKKNKKKGGPVPYDVRSFSYNGEPYTKLVLESYTNEIITASDVSNYLGVKLNHVDKMEQAIKSKSSSGGTIG